jgi:hypothetical protein
MGKKFGSTRLLLSSLLPDRFRHMPSMPPCIAMNRSGLVRNCSSQTLVWFADSIPNDVIGGMDSRFEGIDRESYAKDGIS